VRDLTEREGAGGHGTVIAHSAATPTMREHQLPRVEKGPVDPVTWGRGSQQPSIRWTPYSMFLGRCHMTLFSPQECGVTCLEQV
jgi:hypothetical protein